MICKRAELGKNYGVVLIPEGLIEFIPEISTLIKELNQILATHTSLTPAQISLKLSSASQNCFASLPEKIKQQLLLNRDPHGNVQVSLIETEGLLIDTVSKELEQRAVKGSYKGKFVPLQHFFGYEGRAAFPSNFDCNYCYSLGCAATLLIESGATGYMAFVSNLTQSPQEWGMGGVPLVSLMHIEMRKGTEKPVIKKALVDLSDSPFAYFKKHREHWAFDDSYCYPGPIQFFGDPVLTDRTSITLLI